MTEDTRKLGATLAAMRALPPLDDESLLAEAVNAHTEGMLRVFEHMLARIVALEAVAVAARKLAKNCEVVADEEAPWTYSYDAVNRVYSALAALGEGTDGD